MTSKTKINSDPYKPYWVCDLCYPWMLEIGYVDPLGWLVYNRNVEETSKNKPYSGYGDYEDGSYAILSGQGHGDDEAIYFDAKPCFYEDGNGWQFDHRDLYVPAAMIFNIVKGIKESDPTLFNKIMKQKLIVNMGNNEVIDWLMKRLNRLVKNWERKFGQEIESFYHKEFFLKRYTQCKNKWNSRS